MVGRALLVALAVIACSVPVEAFVPPAQPRGPLSLPSGLCRSSFRGVRGLAAEGWFERWAASPLNPFGRKEDFPARSWESEAGPPPPRRDAGRGKEGGRRPAESSGGAAPLASADLAVTVRQARGEEDETAAGSNFTQAVWTCSPSNFTFFYDERERHLVLEGEAVITPINDARQPCGPSVRIKAGQCCTTPANIALRWEIVSSFTKRTTCREAFRMVANGWILRPPKYLTIPRRDRRGGGDTTAAAQPAYATALSPTGPSQFAPPSPPAPRAPANPPPNEMNFKGSQSASLLAEACKGASPAQLRLRVGREADAKRFYEGSLGMREVSRSSAGVVMGYADEPFSLLLVCDEGMQDKEPSAPTVAQLCVRVPDLQAVCGSVAETGSGTVLEDGSAQSNVGGGSAVLADKWGHKFELLKASGQKHGPKVRFPVFFAGGARRERLLSFYQDAVGMKILRTTRKNQAVIDFLGYGEDAKDCCLQIRSSDAADGAGGGKRGEGLALRIGCKSTDAIATALEKGGIVHRRGSDGEVLLTDPNGMDLAFGAR